MSKVRILIIDSGVRVDHPHLKNDGIQGLTWDGGEMDSGIDDDFGHGTAVYGIIRSVNSFAEIINIRLKDIEEGIDYHALIALLKYIYANIEADLINLSIGLADSECLQELYHACQLLAEKGMIILSAFSNEGCISYPAAFDNVIGVCSDMRCWKNDMFYYIDDAKVNLCAKGGKQRVFWGQPDYIVSQGNSLACAHATVQAAKFMHEGKKTLRDVLCMFKGISQKWYSLGSECMAEICQLTIKNVALFPFSKEMHSFLRYHKLLPFEIKAVYDVKYSAIIGTTTQHCLKDNEVQNLIIKNIRDIEWEEIDTLILGHMDELSALINAENLRFMIIKKALENGRQIFSFDDLNNYGFEKSKTMYFPTIDQRNVPLNRLGMLYRISKPVVGVFGTSPRQGKFTLQLKLREILMKQGYRVGQIGTEPSSLLFGFDYCYPMGYNSSVYIHDFDAVRYLNYIINDLCIKDCEIILVGSQSGTIPFDTGNIMQYTIPQQTFLMGTQPDCVVLCVNPFDDIEYVERTIRYIESSVETKVISIVVFPMDIQEGLYGSLGAKTKLDENKYEKIKAMYESKFNIPIFRLGEEAEMERLANRITDYFS